ncbi:MAG: VWA domain-containing protein, partial [Acidimicrobiales bacterium]
PPRPARGRRAPAPAPGGRLVGAQIPDGPLASVAVGATVRAAAARRSTSPPHRAGPAAGGLALIGPGDVREAVRVRPAANLVVIAVDASGSMGAEQRMTATKGAILGLLLDAYQRRDLVALVAFRGENAEVLLRPTGSVEVARARLAELPTGGRTPLAAGITTAAALAAGGARSTTHRPVLVVVTDGRATWAPGGTDPVEAAEAAAAAVARRGIVSVVVDVEQAEGGRAAPLGLAVRLARLMGAEHVPLRQLTAEALRAAVVTRLGAAASTSQS